MDRPRADDRDPGAGPGRPRGEERRPDRDGDPDAAGWTAEQPWGLDPDDGVGVGEGWGDTGTGWMRSGGRADRAGSRRWPFLVAAVVPWLAVAAFLLRGGGPPSATAEGGAGPVAAPTPAPTPTPAAPVGGRATAASTARDGVPTHLLDTGTRTAIDRSRIAATAVPVARAWITGIGPRLEGTDFSPPGDRFADHLAVEGVDLPSPGAAVVTLLAVTLRAEDDDYRAAELRRLAVPLRVDREGIAPAGDPWWLEGPDLTLRPVEAGETIDDPDLLVEAGTAVAAAGYREVEVSSLATTAGWPLLATVRAVAPGESAPATHVVWLRRHLDGLVVAGSRPPPGAVGGGSTRDEAEGGADAGTDVGTDDEMREGS